MDAITLTWLSTIALIVLVPLYWVVVRAYYRAWKGGDPIRYFGPTVGLLTAIALGASITLVVAVLVLIGRVNETSYLPPGLGLLLIVVALLCPAPFMLALWRDLRGRA